MITVYVDRSPRGELAIQHLSKLGIKFMVENVTNSETAAAFLLNKNRPPARYPLPQFYAGDTLVWENGFKDMYDLTAEQINQRLEEINAINT